MTAALPDPLPKMAVVVINWNNAGLSLACLESLHGTEGVDWHLFLVDNASTDGSRERLQSLGPRVTTIFSDVNGGWTGGNNLGVRAAFDAGYEHIFVLNNDALVRPDTMRLMWDVLDREDASCLPVLGPLQVDGDGRLDFVGASLDPATGIPVEHKAHEVDMAQLAPVFDTVYVRGAALLAHRSHFDAIGLFDDTLYLFYDDTDWCMKALAHRFRVAMVRDAVVVHAGSATVGKQSPLLIYFIVRNGLVFAERYCNARQRLRHAIWLLRWLALMQGRGSRLRRLFAIMLGNSGQGIAARRGLRDYLRRRQGDCPPVIRQLSKSR